MFDVRTYDQRTIAKYIYINSSIRTLYNLLFIRCYDMLQMVENEKKVEYNMLYKGRIQKNIYIKNKHNKNTIYGH